MSEKRWTDDERSEAFERGLKMMEGIALELYRRGREPLLEELETVKRERDEARASVAIAEQRFVDEYDARKAAEREIAELKARITTLEAMR